jgi:carbonic anhydrase
MPRNKESLLQKENSQVHQEVMDANQQYASTFGLKANLPMPPARRFAVLTCMDARLDPAKFAGLAEGDAHVIRNAGGRATDDAIRSLIISHKLLGTREFFVVHHTDCGMELFTDEIMRNLLSKSLKTATIDENGWRNVEESGGSHEANHMTFLTIKNQRESVVEDVARIRHHPLIPKDIPIYGYIYDVKSGRLVEVEEASEEGRAEEHVPRQRKAKAGA